MPQYRIFEGGSGNLQIAYEFTKKDPNCWNAEDYNNNLTATIITLGHDTIKSIATELIKQPQRDFRSGGRSPDPRDLIWTGQDLRQLYDR